MLHYNVSETGEGISNGIEWNGWENAVSRRNRVKGLWDEQFWKFKDILGKRTKMMEQKKTKKYFPVVTFCVYIEHCRQYGINKNPKVLLTDYSPYYLNMGVNSEC